MAKLARANLPFVTLWMLAAVAVPLAAVAAAGALSAVEKAAAARIEAGDIVPHIRFLADDLLEGRAPGSRGERLASRYIAAQLEAAGLEPVGEGGTFFQKVPLVGITPSLPPT